VGRSTHTHRESTQRIRRACSTSTFRLQPTFWRTSSFRPLLAVRTSISSARCARGDQHGRRHADDLVFELHGARCGDEHPTVIHPRHARDGGRLTRKTFARCISVLITRSRSSSLQLGNVEHDALLETLKPPAGTIPAGGQLRSNLRAESCRYHAPSISSATGAQTHIVIGSRLCRTVIRDVTR
jgi:hypothetical protein